MLNTLRGRLILSHVLPLLVIIPVMGITLVYVLETQVLLPNLASELAGQAMLMAELASDHPDLWSNPAQAQAFVARASPHVTARVMLLALDGRLLASSDPTDADHLGQPLELPSLANVLAGEISVHTEYSQHLHAEIADVLVPVVGSDRQALGVVRLSHQLTGVYERFIRLRYVVAGVLVVGLLLGTAVGWVLALNLERPLRQVAHAIYQLASGQRLTPLPEQGPEETRSLLHAINTLAERLRLLEQARRQLLANLVHELGRPLGALRSAVQALTGGADEDVTLRRELLVGMEAEIGRLQRLLDDLARFHDQVLGTLELDRRPVALDDWLPRMLGPWREAAQGKGLHWQVTIPTALPTLEVDPDRLAQVLGNLLSNAIKYTPPGDTVSVSAGVEGEEVWIRVSDTGPGIAPEEQARIFTPFYRGQPGRRFPQGMGLGLSIARDLVVAHGGRLEVESTPGVGSHFTLWLPLSSRAPQP
jgi:two-component system sensor histidine kinase BaeS